MTTQFIWLITVQFVSLISDFRLISKVIILMDDLEDIFSRIRTLAKTNAKVKKGEEVINYIKSNYQTILEEACRVRSPKRRTYGRCEGKLIDDFVALCDYRCDAQNRTTVNYIMSSLKFGGYEDDKPRFRQRMENQMKKLRKLNKSVRPSNRNYFSDSRNIGNSRDRAHGASSSSNLEYVSVKPHMEKSALNSLCKEKLSKEEILCGLLYIPSSEESDDLGDNSLYVFAEDVYLWQSAGVMETESNYSFGALLNFIQQNKDSKQTMPSQPLLFEDYSERISKLFFEPYAINFDF